LIGNLGTKIFHANSDCDTNRIASELVGSRLQSFKNTGTGTNIGIGGQVSMGSSNNSGRSEQLGLEIQPSEFSRLRKGGAENGNIAEALVFQNGRLWRDTGLAWRKVSFKQPQRTRIPAGTEPAVAPAMRR